MLFNLELDPHELNDVSPAHPEVVNRGLALLKAWHDRMMRTGESQIDPMRTVLA